ncbi:MAG: 3-hydroxybutyryl-CoA dehydrogenase [Vampirovibrionales bacterium]|nr:3-hydroxybutyryl-CoA dehydrogenase [Vampirovibrionales bacterium]
MGINNVMVVGAGQMGSGIAQVMAQNGLMTTLFDVSEAQLEKARVGIIKSLSKLVEKGKLTADQQHDTLNRLCLTSVLEDAAPEADLVVEAIVEHEATKVALFKQLDDLCPAHALLSSNTSSISITRLAAATQRPHQVMGMHFMNPVPLMQLVELIRGAQTSEATYEAIHALTLRLGKTPAVSNDLPGFLSNRILMPMLNEAMFAVYEGVGTPEAVDTVMKLGMNHPMGPLTLADFIGLDTCLAILNVLHDGFKDPKYRPCPLLKQYVDAGWLGKKTGRGFYTYS